MQIARNLINGGFGWWGDINKRTIAIAQNLYEYLLKNKKNYGWRILDIGNSEEEAMLRIAHIKKISIPKGGRWEISIDIGSSETIYTGSGRKRIPGVCSITMFSRRMSKKVKRGNETVRFRHPDDDKLLAWCKGWLSLSCRNPFLAEKDLLSIRAAFEKFISENSEGGWDLREIRLESKKESFFDENETTKMYIDLIHPLEGDYRATVWIEEARERKYRPIKPLAVLNIVFYSIDKNPEEDRRNYRSAAVESRDQNKALKWAFGWMKLALKE